MTKKCAHTDYERRVDESYNGCILCDNEVLRGNLSLAEEGLANYALGVDGLQKQIEILQRANRFLSEQIPSAHEPLPCAPRESDWCCTHCGRDNDPSETHCVHCEWSRKHTVAGVLHERGCEDNPCRCGALKSRGASRDASSEPSERHVDWEAEYKKLAGVYTREGLEKFIADHWPGNVLADATESKSNSCHCPAKPGEDCPLTSAECDARRAQTSYE